jgi:hypothetical protein
LKTSGNRPFHSGLHSQGVDVLPKAQTINPPPSRIPLRPPPKPPLEQRNVVREEPNHTLARRARYGGLPEHEQFMSKAGRPKEDTFFGLWKMSTGYKQILGGLERYHGAFGQEALKDVPGKDELQTTVWLQTMREELDDLHDSTSSYLRKGGHTRKEEVRQLQSQIEHDTRVVQRLLNDIEKGGTIPDMPLSDIVAYARQGIQLKDMEEFHARGLSPNEARELVDNEIARAKVINQWDDYLEAGFTIGEALLLERHGLGLDGGKLYREWNLAITEDTIVKGCRDDVLLAPMTRLGKGKFNEVFTSRYDSPDGEFRGVFKPLKKPDPTRTQVVEKTWVAGEIGIDRYDPQIAMRCLATCETAKLLGFDVVPRTEIGIGTPPPPSNQEPQLGLVMDHAKGFRAKQYAPRAFNNPDVRREVTKLQLLDHLTGQGDRHGNNYFIHEDESGKITVTGIDNDLCFGKKPHDPNGIGHAPTVEKIGFNGTGMPPVMDTDMVEAFEKLTPEILEKSLAGKLTAEEIEAAKKRLEGIKKHIETLRANNMIIEPEEWGDPKVTQALTRDNSYVGREGKLGPDPDTQELDEFDRILQQFLLDE